MTPLYLRGNTYNGWALYAEKGHQVSPTFRGDKSRALDEARAWASTWSGWKIITEEDNE